MIGRSAALLATVAVLACVVRSQSYRVETTTEPVGSGTHYAFRIVYEHGPSTAVASLTNPVWQWGFYLPDMAESFEEVTTPAGWNWTYDPTTGLLSFFTGGPNGWGSGDYGNATLAPNASLDGFGLWSRFPPAQTLGLAYDTTWHRERAYVTAPAAPMARLPLMLGPLAFGEGIVFHLDTYRQGDQAPTMSIDTPLLGNSIGFGLQDQVPVTGRLQGGTWLARRFTIPQPSSDRLDLDPLLLINGDVNGDNSVNLADFLALRGAFGATTDSPKWNPGADLNRDGTVNVMDFLVLRSGFGQIGDP
ncbi:MAG: hypothetical protein KIS66_00960 [Fimbriimonadaceae bacterium]|nr:hypothetical protein [Fimbriimonadaceae bacterium]